MPPKRKRPERGPSDGGGGRPSPHRPEQTTLGQHDRNNYDGGGRGGRGGRNNPRRNDRRDFSQTSQPPVPAPANPTVAPPRSPTFQRPSNIPQPSSAPHATVVAPVEPPTEPPAPIDSGYIYDIVTDESIEKWESGAREEIQALGVQARQNGNTSQFSSILQEFIHSVIDLRIDPVLAGNAVKEIIGTRSEEAGESGFAFDPHVLFLDCISIILEVEGGVYRSQLRDFMAATEVSTTLVRQILDPDLLNQLGLLRNTFSKMAIRQSTNLLYRQANYNLLREESEGFSKLMTELYASCSNAAPEYSFTAARTAFDRVKALIGTFDLDVGRTLDVTLDVFATTVIKHPKFFVKFLRISSWWPGTSSENPESAFLQGLPRWAQPEFADQALDDETEASMSEERRKRDVRFWGRVRETHLDAFFELGGREVADDAARRLAEHLSTSPDDEDEEQRWIQITKTLPPQGNRIAAQLLGFKLRFYISEHRKEDDVLPANILYLSALLIKTGFISLCDLYPHLWPLDEDMATVREKKAKELEEKERKNRPGGAMNALMMADALPDDMPPPPSSSTRRDALSGKQEATSKAAEESQKPKLPEPLDQKVQLLEHLLTIGALPESLYILGRLPWLVDSFSDTILPLIHRIIKYSLTKVAQDSQPIPTITAGCPPKKMADADQSGVPKGSVKQSELQSKRPLRWPFPDKYDVADGQTYRYYFDEWVDTIPICQTVDDVFSLCNSFINISGVNIGRDPELLTKIATIGLKSLKDDQSEANLGRWHDLLKRLLVPALSLSPPNPSVNDAIWTLLQFYPTAVRYAIYAEWYEGATSRLPAMSAAFARSRLKTLSTMKRLSLTNIKTMARTLAKTTWSSPGIVFKVALDQIEAYSNLIQVFVECGKYFTHLGHDVLVWSLMSSLGGKQRSRTQESSVLLTSKWLQALSKFSGNVFKRYSIMDPTPVIQYVNDQLLKGNSTDLVILKELILTMGGLVSDMDFTDAQLRAMTGGKILRRQTLINLQDKRFESTKSAKRLMQALVDTRLAGRLLINIAQYRQAAIFKASELESHIKYLSTVVDDSHQVFAQYLDLLRSNLDPEKFDDLVPDIGRLMGEFGLDVTLAFMVTRAGLAHRLLDSPAPASPVLEQDKSQSIQLPADKDGDVAMKGDDSADTAGNPDASDLNGEKMVVDAKEAENTATDSPAPTMATADRKKADPFFDVLQPAIASVQAVVPGNVWDHMSPEFYAIFWTLQLGDLAVPRPSYEAAHALLKKQAEDVMKDRSDMSRSGMNLKNAKRDQLLDLSRSILQEMVSHAERNQKLKIRLLRQSSTWFPGTSSQADAVSDNLLEQCIFPRLLLSASDTEYAFRLLKFLHENKTPNFKLMSFYERLFQSNRLRDLIFSCTVREAEHLGRFFRCILGDLARWHSDKTLYEKEALGHTAKDGRRTYLGFAESFDDDGKPATFVQHPQFRDLLYGWHKNFNIALKDCLENTEWMHIRNAITIIKFVLEFFPAVDFMGRQFAEQLKKITEREAASKTASESEAAHRVDLSVAAQTAFSELQRRRSKWVMVQAFRPNASGKNQDESKAGETTSLRPTAPEFKPKSAATTGPGQSTNDAEDGEVKDGKSVPTSSNTSTASSRPNVPSRPMPTERESAGAPAKSSRPSTPKPSTAATTNQVPGRPEPSKPSGLTSLPHPSSLPNRPDVPVPGRGFGSDRFGSGRPQDRREPVPRDAQEPRDRSHRDSRDPRESNHPRDLRDGRDFRSPDAGRSRDSSGPDRRMAEGASRDMPRHSERERSSRNDATPRRQDHQQPPERDSRTPRDRQNGPSRGQDRVPSKEQPTPTPPAGPASQPAPQEAGVNPERARLIASGDRPEIMNPARAAFFGDSRSTPSRGPREESKDRASSRAQSPKGSDGRTTETATPDRNRDGRQSRPPHNDQQGPGRDNQGEGGNSLPKDRAGDYGADRANAERGFRGATSRQSETDHGRLNHQDPNYGRLNPIQSVADIPSGPRGRGRDSRVGSMNAPPRPDARFSNPETPRAPSPDRQPPSGPSSSRQRRGRGGQFEPGPSAQSPAAATPPPSTGVHPDRARHLDTAQAPSHGPGNSAPPSNSSVGVHPSRLQQIAPPPPPPPPPPPHASRNNLPQYSSPMTGGPSGPRGQPGSLPATPSGDYRGNHSTPTGPSPSNERTRNRSERMMRGIQDTLSGSGGRRGGGHRGQIAGSDAQVLTGGSPVSTPVFERNDPMRRDLGPERPPAAPNGEDHQGTSGRDHERSGRRDHRSDRSGRASRRSSRERSQEREGKAHREHRDRRSDVQGMPAGPGAAPTNNAVERDTQGPRRPGREPSMTNRDAPGVGIRDPNHEPLGGGRESRQRGEGRGDGGSGRPPEEWGGNGRGPRGGGGPRGGDDQRRDGREDRGRKRRSEEGAGLMGNDREKRQRR